MQLIQTRKMDGDIYMVMEYMNSGDLLKYIQNHPELTEDNFFDMALQIAKRKWNILKPTKSFTSKFLFIQKKT